MGKTFDEVKVGDKVRYYDPPIKGNKELETKDYKGGEYDAVVTGFGTLETNEFEGFVDLVYEDPKWLPENPPSEFKTEMKDNKLVSVEVKLEMPEPGRNIQVTGVPFRGRAGSKTRSWDFE